MGSAGQGGFPCFSTLFTSSSHQQSRSLIIETGVRLLVNTITRLTDGHCTKASSTTVFKGTSLVPLKPPSAVITRLHWASSIRSAIDWAEKPPKTTECTAPIRAQANTAIANSGTMGIYIQIRSPFLAPLFLSTWANWDTLACSSL